MSDQDSDREGSYDDEVMKKGKKHRADFFGDEGSDEREEDEEMRDIHNGGSGSGVEGEEDSGDSLDDRGDDQGEDDPEENEENDHEDDNTEGDNQDDGDEDDREEYEEQDDDYEVDEEEESDEPDDDEDDEDWISKPASSRSSRSSSRSTKQAKSSSSSRSGRQAYYDDIRRSGRSGKVVSYVESDEEGSEEEQDSEDSGEEFEKNTRTARQKRLPPMKKKVSKRPSRGRDIKFDSTDDEDELSSGDESDFDDEFGPRPPKVEDTGPRIDKLFDHRMTDGRLEWFMKWQGKSYNRCEWIGEEIINEIPGGKQRIRNFRAKPPPQPREPYFSEDFLLTDRIIAVRKAVFDEDDDDDGSENDYLVKWRGLSYAEATWEKEKTLPEEEIALFERRNEYPRSKALPRLTYRKGIEPPVFKNESFKLRQYQVTGFRWLIFSYSKDVNVILGDEMGLGKTIQSISFLYYLFNERNNRGPFLVVAPLVTLEQWRREIESWTEMNCVLFHGSKEDRATIIDNEFYFGQKSSAPYKFNILVTTYELVIQETEVLSMIPWEYMVLDEGHRIKNQQSKLLLKLNELDLKNKLVLTGTPLQNHIHELWTILNFLNQSHFPSREEFLEEYEDLTSAKALQLQKRLKRYLLRRMKSTVENSLPTKEEKIIEVELTSVQKQYYRALLDRNRDFLQRGLKKKSQMASLRNIMMELRKCCSHPYLIPGAEERILAGGGNVGESLILSSAKLVVVDKLLKKLREEKRQVLIFSQMKLILDLLEDFLRFRGYPFERLDGGIKKELRVAAIDRFTNQKGDQFVFLLSTRAGGLGLNLTRADTVIIFDSDFNPQNDLQAMARAHRIGQTNNVVVYRLVTRGTYEQRMLEIAGKKMALDTAVLRGMGGEDGNAKETDLSANEMDQLLRYGAYHLFQDNDEEEKQKDQMLQEEDIDEILKRASTVVHRDEDEGASSGNKLSKMSFCLSEKDVEVDLNADDFWEKVLPEYKTLESLKQDLNEGKVVTPEEQSAFLAHLETLVQEAREKMALNSGRVGEVQGLVDLNLFLEKVQAHGPLSEKLRTKALYMASSLQLKKRSRPSASATALLAEEPPNKRAKKERQTKEQMIKMNKSKKKNKAYDDEDFHNSDDDFAPDDKKKSKKGSSAPSSDWSATNLKKVRQLVLKYPGCSVERMYELTPPSLQRSKTISQFKEVVSCFLYLALDTVAGSGGSDRKTQQKFGRVLKKLLSVNQAMIADFKSLSFTPQSNLPAKDSKKSIKISVDNAKSLNSIEPGQVLQVQLAISEGMHEPQKALYFEIFGKIPFYCGDLGKVSDTRFFFQRIEAKSGKQTLEVHAPGCPGEYAMKCVKMYLKDGPRDYKHIVCGQLSFTVVPSEVIKDGIGMTSRTAGMIVSRGVFMDAIQSMARNPDSIPILSKMPVWWWTTRDDKALTKGYDTYGYEGFDEIEKDPELGFSYTALCSRLKSLWKNLPREQQDKLRDSFAKPKGKKKESENGESELDRYCSERMKALRPLLTKHIQSIVKSYDSAERALTKSPASSPNGKKRPKLKITASSSSSKKESPKKTVSSSSARKGKSAPKGEKEQSKKSSTTSKGSTTTTNNKSSKAKTSTTKSAANSSTATKQQQKLTMTVKLSKEKKK